MIAGRLALCPTPIGNLEDVTVRVLRVLGEADVIACEDTRRTRILLDRHAISAPALISVHEHNERERAAALVERIRAGELVALVSDAGMPGISDPGFVVVRACLRAGLDVEVLPGASSVLVALVASGLAVERWSFVGFLPRRRGDLEGVLAESGALVAFESPHRVAATLAVLAETQPDRTVAVCRELTKLHEEVVRGSAAELAVRYAEADPRGEVVVVLGTRPATTPPLEPALAALERLVEAGARVRPAARVVAELTGVAANALYRARSEG